MPAADYRSLVRLIDQLYASALDPDSWPTFLGSVAEIFEAQNAFVCQLQDRRQPLQYISLSQNKRDLLPVASYPSLIDEDPRAPRFGMGLGRPVHCGMGLERATLHGSRAYRDYLKPLDIEYTMVLVFPTEDAILRPGGPVRRPAGRVTHDLGLIRGASGRAFDAADSDLLSEIGPHIQRAFTIQRALEIRGQQRKSPPASPQAPPPETVLEQALRLTPAQARTAALLMQGRSTRQIAEELGIAHNSVLQYLKRIYERTGTRRQADLVRVAYHACEQTAR